MNNKASISTKNKKTKLGKEAYYDFASKHNRVKEG